MFGSCNVVVCFFFFKQKTAYELRISDWSSDVCSSDLFVHRAAHGVRRSGQMAAEHFGDDQEAALRIGAGGEITKCVELSGMLDYELQRSCREFNFCIMGHEHGR